MSNIDKYTQFISEQVRKSGGVIREEKDEWTAHLSEFGKHMAKFEDDASGHPSELYDSPEEAKEDGHPTFDPAFVKMKTPEDVHDHYAYDRGWANDKDFKRDIKYAVAHAKRFKPAKK